jgi:hypothetical protein
MFTRFVPYAVRRKAPRSWMAKGEGFEYSDVNVFGAATPLVESRI